MGLLFTVCDRALYRAYRYNFNSDSKHIVCVERRGSVVERRGSVVERRCSVVERRGSVSERRGSVVERRIY